MSKTINLMPSEPVVCEDSSVLRVDESRACLICAFDPGSELGGALLVKGHLEANRRIINRFFVDILERSKSASVSVKLVGSKGDIDRIKEMASVYSVRVVGEMTLANPHIVAFFHTQGGKLQVQRDGLTETREPQAEIRVCRVLIVDDSEVMRRILREILGRDREIDVVGDTGNPLEAEALIARLRPDVLTLDINMPKMDGLTLLETVVNRFPISAVMITAIGKEEGDMVLRALQLGAFDYVEKPSQGKMGEMGQLIIEKIKAAALYQMRGADQFAPEVSDSPEHGLVLDPSRVIAVGASTGGTRAIEYFMRRLVKDIPPIVIAQHIPAAFSKPFADHLNEKCPFEVREAIDGDILKAGCAYIAPGGRQMVVEKTGRSLGIRIFDLKEQKYKPCVDILFKSVADAVGEGAVGILVTGMGSDGAQGLLEMRKAGCHTIAEDEKSCIVFGMPKEAILRGGAVEISSLEGMARNVMRAISITKVS